VETPKKPFLTLRKLDPLRESFFVGEAKDAVVISLACMRAQPCHAIVAAELSCVGRDPVGEAFELLFFAWVDGPADDERDAVRVR
jgi:hypothetical protein